MEALTEEYLWVSIIGFIVGITELASRYRDNPARALWNFPAALYILFNIVAALLAIFLIKDVFQWNFNLENIVENKTKIKVIGILVAGLGAMAFFRSSLFVFRVGDKDVPLGPGIVLQVLLDVTDRAVDRSRAHPRAAVVSKIMQEVDFSKAQAALPAYCFALMQNVTAEEQANFGRQISQLAASVMSHSVKGLALGLALMNLVGDAVLRAAVESLGAEIKNSPPGGMNAVGVVVGSGVTGSGVTGSSVTGSGATGSGATGSGATGSGATGSGGTGSGGTGSGGTGSEVTGSSVTGSGITGSSVTGSSVPDSGATGSGITGSSVTGSGATGSGITGSEATGSRATSSVALGRMPLPSLLRRLPLLLLFFLLLVLSK